MFTLIPSENRTYDGTSEHKGEHSLEKIRNLTINHRKATFFDHRPSKVTRLHSLRTSNITSSFGDLCKLRVKQFQ